MEMERERLTQYSRYGRRTVPTTASSIAVGVAFGVVGIGILGLGLISSLTTHAPESLFACVPGLIFLGIGVLTGVLGYFKAQQYERAYRDYQDRRTSVMGESVRRRDEDY
jgi:uncharacterized membrane protein YidH (DUF202 family)